MPEVSQQVSDDLRGLYDRLVGEEYTESAATMRGTVQPSPAAPLSQLRAVRVYFNGVHRVNMCHVEMEMIAAVQSRRQLLLRPAHVTTFLFSKILLFIGNRSSDSLNFV